MLSPSGTRCTIPDEPQVLQNVITGGFEMAMMTIIAEAGLSIGVRPGYDLRPALHLL
jgi:hypothetical protein